MFPLINAVRHHLAELRIAILHAGATRLLHVRRMRRSRARVQGHDILAQLLKVTAAFAKIWTRRLPGSDQDITSTMGRPDDTWWRIALLASKR